MRFTMELVGFLRPQIKLYRNPVDFFFLIPPPQFPIRIDIGEGSRVI